MHEDQVTADTFVPAPARDVTSSLDAATVHLWWLPYRRADGRAPLKSVLADYLDIDAKAVVLVDDAHGRPRLADTHALDFNWSHSGDHAVIAVARELRMLGVDIERRRSRPRVMALATRFFAREEYALLQALPVEQREAGFVRLWTAKEAVLKAHGRGIAYGLERVVFTLDGTTVRPQRFLGEVGDVGQWQFHALQPASGFVGMLAWRGAPRTVRCFARDGSATAVAPKT